MLKQGKADRKIIDQCIREGKPLPDRIANAPELWWGNELYYLAWVELDSTRTVAMAEGQIPTSAIQDFCVWYDIDGEQREDLLFHVRALDNAYLEWRASKRDASKAPQATPAAKPPVRPRRR